MSADLEKLRRYFAELAAQRGNPKFEQVSTLAGIAAEIAREEDAPKYIDEAVFDRGQAEKPVPSQELLSKLVALLAAEGEKPERDKSILNTDFAEILRTEVFQHLDDGIHIADLRMPTKTLSTSWIFKKYPATYQFPDELFEKALNISMAVKGKYNFMLGSLLKAGLETVGSARRARERELLQPQGVGVIVATFVKTAFAPTEA